METISKYKADYNKGCLKIKQQELYGKISKFREAQWKIVEDMQKHGLDISTQFKEEYDQALNLFQCYDELYKLQPEDEKELSYINWLFNDGRLRTQKELDSFKDKDIEEGVFLSGLGKLNEESNRKNKTSLAMTLMLSPVLPGIITLLYYDVDVDIQPFWIMFDILYVISFALHWIIIGALSLNDDIKYHKKAKKLYEQHDKKNPVDYGLIASAASYSLFLTGVIHSLKKK